MPTDAINKIKEAEKNAARAVENARERAATIINDARRSADAEVNDAKDMAARASAVAREAAEAEAVKRANRVNNEIKLESAALTAAAAKNRRAAVAFIVENLMKRGG